MAKTIGYSLLLLLLFDYSQALIVPQELPTLLSIVYSNIPPIKKGKDSRYGVGFRLGEHADFQLLFEFGPQTETKKIGGTSTSSKREIDQNEFFQGLSREQTPIKTQASSWLTNWSKGMTAAQQKRKKQPLTPKKRTTTSSTTPTTSSTTTTTVRTVPLISEDALKQLSQLFKVTVTIGMNQGTTAIPQSIEVTTRSPAEQKKISEELMDVNVEK